MARVSVICPNCGYDFETLKIKNFQQEISELLQGIDKQTRKKIKEIVAEIDKFSEVKQYDIWKFLGDIKDIESAIIDRALNEFYQGNHEMKGINYLKGMILNLNAHKDQLRLLYGSKPPIRDTG